MLWVVDVGEWRCRAAGSSARQAAAPYLAVSGLTHVAQRHGKPHRVTLHTPVPCISL